MEFFQNGQGLLLGTVLQDTLDHPAAIWMSGQNKHLHTERNKTFINPQCDIKKKDKKIWKKIITYIFKVESYLMHLESSKLRAPTHVS